MAARYQRATLLRFVLCSAHCFQPLILPLIEYWHDGRLDRLSRHFRRAVADVHVHFGADAEVAFKIDARLDGEAGARDQAARVTGLKVVYVRAVAVDFFADGMAR